MILVDSNYICYVAKHSLKGLSYQEKKVGVIFGFLRQILSLAKVFETNKFIFVWDSQSSLRKEIFPAYKARRKTNKTEEDLELDALSYPQFDDLRNTIIPYLGFTNNHIQIGYEADDLIAVITKTGDEYIIVSADEDLYQLLSETVSLYSIRKKQLYTAKNLYKDYGVTPKQWAMVKAISGCSTDEIPGIVGVGEKTAAKYIRKQLPFNTKTHQSILKGTEIIRRNTPLVDLPFKGTLPITYKRDHLSLDCFVEICKTYGFNSFLTREVYQQWKNHVFTSSKSEELFND
jgi:DNA polymerase-1